MGLHQASRAQLHLLARQPVPLLPRPLLHMMTRPLLNFCRSQPMQLLGKRRLHRRRTSPLGTVQSRTICQLMQLLARPLLHRRRATQRSLPLDKISQVLSKLSLFGKVRQSQVLKQMQLRGPAPCLSKEPSTPLYPQAPPLWQYRYRQKYRRHRPS
jgi:hypothetical protein